MEWLEELAERRRAKDDGYAEEEVLIEADGAGYEVELVADADGKPLSSPVLVLAGDVRGNDHI